MKGLTLAIIVAGGLGLAIFVGVALHTSGAFDPPPNPQERIGMRWLLPPGTEAEYVGNEACRSCHPRQFAAHAASPHARTVRQLSPGEEREEFRSHDTVTDPVHGITYRVQAAAASQAIALQGEQAEIATPRWVFGSGTRAWSYLGQTRDGFLEFRITYYPPARRWDFTPGRGPQDTPERLLGTVYNDREAAACFGCHGTVLIGSGKRMDLARSRLNVGCESCHGPSRRHVERARAAARGGRPFDAATDTLIRPSRLTGSAVMELCGRCHRVPADVPENHPAAEAQLARFPGVALARSRCYTESGGRLSCVTCHDPHAGVSHDQRHYDRACLRCHTPPGGTRCAADQRSACAGCHLVEEPIARKLPLRFHNHWIRRRMPDADLLEMLTAH